MQQLLIWQNGMMEKDASQQMLQQALQDPKAQTWLDIYLEDSSTKYEKLLKETFQLTNLTLDAIQEPKERSRLIEQNGYFYLVMHGLAFNPETHEAETPKIDIVFGHNFLITIRHSSLSWLQQMCENAQKEGNKEQFMGRGTARLLHLVLDTLVDSYFPVLDVLDDEVDELEDATISNASKEVQNHIFRMKKAFAQMRRVVSPQIEVMNALITRTGDFIPTEAEPYFADVHDHLVRTFEVLDSYRDLMSGLLDVYLSTVSNRLNETMKQLTLISTIFLPITFITGIFGQNFGHSPQVDHDPGYNFWIVLAFMTIVTIIQLIYFKYRRWI